MGMFPVLLGLCALFRYVSVGLIIIQSDSTPIGLPMEVANANRLEME